MTKIASELPWFIEYSKRYNGEHSQLDQLLFRSLYGEIWLNIPIGCSDPFTVDDKPFFGLNKTFDDHVNDGERLIINLEALEYMPDGFVIDDEFKAPPPHCFDLAVEEFVKSIEVELLNPGFHVDCSNDLGGTEYE